MYCATPGEANSIFAIKSPICGSSPEIVPACAPYKDNSGNYACYGRGFITGHIDARITQAGNGSWITDIGPFTFNDFPYTAKDVYVCDANNFCCAPGADDPNNPGCDDSNVPKLPANCQQDYSITPSVEICGVVAGNPNPPPNFTGKSDTDARIYFPHVKNTSSVVYLLQSMYRPVSWTIDQIKNNVVYSKLFEHQGIDDDTPVINPIDNNSSVIPDHPAPTPAFDFQAPPEGVPANGACVIENVRTNPGDDLLGKKIHATLTYTQKFEYDLVDGDRNSGCSNTGQIADNESSCCSGSGTPNYSLTIPRIIVNYTCNPHYIGLPTQGKTLVYTKSPFLEYLYQNLVDGPAAIYRRFVSQDTAKDIQDISTKSTIKVSSTAQQTMVADAGSSATADIYFPHLGSIYDYFLKNLQKLLRPKDTADTTAINPSVIYQPGQTPINPTCQASCSHPNLPPSLQQIAAIAGSIYHVPPSLIIGILWSEGGLNNPITDIDVRNNRHPACNCPDGAAGACGPAQIIGGADGFLKKLALPEVQVLAANLGWDISLPYTPNRCTYSDSIFEIADKLSVGRGGIDYQAVHGESQQCVGITMNKNLGPSTSCNWSDADVVTAARQYLGYCEEPGRDNPRYDYDTPTPQCQADPNECYQQKLLNFMASNCLQNYSPPASTAPPNPSPVVSGGGFTVSGTFSQICQSAWYGIRRQAGTNNCVRCFDGKVTNDELFGTTYGTSSNVFRCPQSIVDLNANVCQDSESDFSVTPINSPDNWCARCFQRNVIDMQSCSTINTSQGLYECPTGQICRVGNTEATGIDAVCQPQVCPNPGSVSGSGVPNSGQGKFCCLPKIHQ